MKTETENPQKSGKETPAVITKAKILTSLSESMEGESFIEEIDYRELHLYQVVGRGAFGIVKHGKWRGTDVAVKHIETESEKKAFITELKQLSRVSHPNIVCLYGACTNTPVCLVMEYAEGGSLYNVLHGHECQPDYTIGHAMSWCHQCALGVEYLHGMKPRPLIHRDLKPPNLLLIAGGTKLKICDFGTACDAHTHMTNNKGSAAWMAPEVFEGVKYSEKCDVFSFGIILWEVLTRRKPFDEIGGPAFRIMWAVHNGTRPPLIVDCPKPIEFLMTRCWSDKPVERPSMGEVARVMTRFMPYCEGGDQPLVYPHPPAIENVQMGSVYDTPPLTLPSPGTGSSTIHEYRDTVRQAFGKMSCGEPVPVLPVTRNVEPVVVANEVNIKYRRSQTSAPASLAASRESLLDKNSRPSTPSMDLYKRYSADLSKLDEVDLLNQAATMGQTAAKPPARGHRRTGSHGTLFVTPATSTNNNILSPARVVTPKGRGHRRTGSYGNTPHAKSSSDLTESPGSMTHAYTEPTTLSSSTTSPGGTPVGSAYRASSAMSWTHPSTTTAPSAARLAEKSKATQAEMLNNIKNIPMDYQLQPLPPCKTNRESMEIYNEHLKLSEEFYRIQVEIMVLEKRNDELDKQLEMDAREEQTNNQLVEEYTKLVAENENLSLLRKNVSKYIDNYKREQQERQARQKPVSDSEQEPAVTDSPSQTS